MFENLQSVTVFSPSFTEILLGLLLSFLCSFIISVVYRYTYKGVGYSQSFVHSLVFLSLITTLVIMTIGNNLARAFGLVGALSIIRFRTAIKDTSDLVYIFLSLALGLSAGVGYYKLTITGTILIGLLLILFAKTGNGAFNTNRYLLQFKMVGDKITGQKPFISPLEQYCSFYEIMNIRSDEINKAMVYSYNIRLKKISDAELMIDMLRQIDGIKDVNMFFDQQPI